jgi:sulfur relay (sulfurtransferase) complex TusBCD TusD component (DsrE family)
VARGVTELDLKDKNARFITLEQLAEMYATNDKVVVF